MMTTYAKLKQAFSEPKTIALLKEGTICTPFPLIEEIVDKLPIQWDNSKLKFLDLACGRGAFLFVIKHRLLQAGHSEQHIVESMLYGIDIEQQNAEVASIVVDPSGKYKNNIECTNALTKEFKMKFDVVIGNPPYQDTTSVNTKNLWPKFVNEAFRLTNEQGIVALVTPRTWTTNEMYDEVFLIRQPIHINVDECARHFPGVNSTFSYFIVRDTPPSESIFTVQTQHGNISMSKLPTSGLGASSATTLRIMERVSTENYFAVATSSGYNTMKFSKNDSSVSRTPLATHPYKVLHKTLKTGDEFFYSNHLDTSLYGVPRVILNLWVANYNDMRVSTELLTCEQFRHFPTRTKDEANVLRGVLLSPLYKFIARTMVSGGSFTTRSVSRFPYVDLTRPWTDEQLYKHFNLTKEEIKLIEDTIK